MSIEVGAKLQGKVSGITNFGAFIDLGAGKTGLVHISEVSNGYVKDIHDVLSVGDEVTVKVISVNDDGKIGLSIRKAQEQPAESGEESRPKKYQQKDPRDNRNRPAQKKSFSRSQPSAQKEDFFLSKSISYADFALAIGNAVMEEWQGVYLIAEKE